MVLGLYKIGEIILYFLGFIVIVGIGSLLTVLLLRLAAKIVPKLSTTKKRRLTIAFSLHTVLYILFVADVYTEEYRVSGFEGLSYAYDLSLPRSYASEVEYPMEWQGGDDFGVIKQVKFIGQIQQESIDKMDALCEQTKQMEDSPEGVICQYPYFNNIQNEQTGFNPKRYPRGWSKKDNVYYYHAESGSWYYYFTLDISTNTATYEEYKW
jgi:hypothetical protein